MTTKYIHISNLYKSTEILLFKECYCLEKIHGTFTYINWDGKEVTFFSGGEIHEKFVRLFNRDNLIKIFTEHFGDKVVKICGEGYGGKQQGMSHTYGPNLKFIVFDVKVEDCWLDVPKAEKVAQDLGLEFVHYEKVPTDIAILDKLRDSDSVQAVRNGMGEGHLREGIVIRPLIECTKNNGERIIAKHKGEKFSERLHPPKIVDAERLEVLQHIQEIVDEWCTEMRLNHILQKFPIDVGIEKTSEIIKEMISDIYREAKNEIIESKELCTMIGRTTAKLFKEYLSNNRTM